MRFRFIRVGGKLHWYLDSKNGFLGWSYPVFHRGSLCFLISLLIPRLRRRFFSPPTLSDLERAKRFQEWSDSLPSDPTKPFHDILDS